MRKALGTNYLFWEYFLLFLFFSSVCILVFEFFIIFINGDLIINQNIEPEALAWLARIIIINFWFLFFLVFYILARRKENKNLESIDMKMPFF